MALKCNESNGFLWTLTDLERFRRFLYLDAEKGTYISDAKWQPQTLKSPALDRITADEKGAEVIKLISQLKTKDTPIRKEYAFATFVQCAKLSPSLLLRQESYTHFSEVMLTSQDLLRYACIVNSYGPRGGTGWGRAFRRAVGVWYNSKDPLELARLVTKEMSFMGWRHRDVLRCSHVKPNSQETGAVLKYLAMGQEKMKAAYPEDGPQDKVKEIRSFLQAFEDLKRCEDKERLRGLIETHRMSVEHVPSRWHKTKEAWQALVRHMPLSEVLPHLGKLTSQGMFAPKSSEAAVLCDRLGNDECLKESKLHPLHYLQAWKFYKSKKAKKGKVKWNVNKRIADALESAICRSFKYLDGTGKRMLLAIDVSSSMGLSGVNGSPCVTAREVVSLMAMQTVRTEKDYHVMAFSKEFQNIGITSQMSLEETKKKIGELPWGTTNCAYPMIWAQERKIPVDVFYIYTDCETSWEDISPVQSLHGYRRAMKIDAKLAVIALTSNGFSVADAEDGGMLDIAGFNSKGPELLRLFALNEL